MGTDPGSGSRHTTRRHAGKTGAQQGAGARSQGTAPRERDSEVGKRFFRSGGARPRTEEINTYIDEHRHLYGVEPICKVLQVASSAYWRHATRRRNPELRSGRARRDEQLMVEIRRVWEQNFRVYPTRKVWRQLNREGMAVARCIVERLMHRLGIVGIWRGKRVRTTVPDSVAACPHVAFIIDAYAKRIVGWRASGSMTTDFVLDAFEQAVYERKPTHSDGLIHHFDRGSQYVSIRYSDRLSEASINPSVGSTGSAYDNALAETINGLHKTEVIHRKAPWNGLPSESYALPAYDLSIGGCP